LKKLAFIIAALVFFSFHPQTGFGAFLYKNYLIRQDGDLDILCDPYIVQKDDWVLKLFRTRGQISEQDFHDFLILFSKLNPSIKDLNKIMPGQHILIPLKKLLKSSLPGQSTGVVTIPFVTISKLPEAIQENSLVYEIRRGDNVSGIVSRTYTKNGNLSYGEAIKLFKLINPEIADIDRIYPGQEVNIPKSTVDSRKWYQSLSTSPEAGVNAAAFTLNSSDGAGITGTPFQSQDALIENSPQNKHFVTVASTLDAKLMYKGKYHFPKTSQADFVLDLAKYPVMELPDGSKVLFQKDEDISTEDQALLRSHWNNLKFTTLSLQSSFEEIMSKVVSNDDDFKGQKLFSFEDRGVKITVLGKWMVASKQPGEGFDRESSVNRPFTFISIVNPKDKPIAPSIKKFLGRFNITIKEITPEGDPLYPDTSDACEGSEIDKKIIYALDVKDFVKEFASSLGFRYTEKSDISFPYADLQVEAASNLISTHQGSHLLVDYGDLYGDAVSSIRKAGLEVLQVTNEMGQSFIAGEILRELKIKYAYTPEVMAVDRPENLTVSVHIPGLIYRDTKGEEYIITSALPDDNLVCFLNSMGYKMLILYKPRQPVVSSMELQPVAPN
jgi:hypothetical protein